MVVRLYHPRNDAWDEHFEWHDSHALIRGLTLVGRATVARFKMNRPRIVLARKRWAQAGLHPIVEDSD